MSLSKILLLILLCLAGYGCTSSQNGAVRNAKSRGDGGLSISSDGIAARLDSLAAISHRDYIHLYIGPCLGRCEAYVSIFRESPATFHIYEAEGWRYDEFNRGDILYRLRRPLTSDVAENLFQRASEIGLLTFVDDQTTAVTDHPMIWLRARIGDRTISLDEVHLGGERYAGAGREQGLYKAYTQLRMLLLAELYGRNAGTDGR